MGPGSELGKGLQLCYLRASRWVHTWEKTLSTEPSALTCGEMGHEGRMPGKAGWAPPRQGADLSRKPGQAPRAQPQRTAGPHATSGETKAQTGELAQGHSNLRPSQAKTQVS